MEKVPKTACLGKVSTRSSVEGQPGNTFQFMDFISRVKTFLLPLMVSQIWSSVAATMKSVPCDDLTVSSKRSLGVAEIRNQDHTLLLLSNSHIPTRECLVKGTLPHMEPPTSSINLPTKRSFPQHTTREGKEVYKLSSWSWKLIYGGNLPLTSLNSNVLEAMS